MLLEDCIHRRLQTMTNKSIHGMPVLHTRPSAELSGATGIHKSQGGVPSPRLFISLCDGFEDLGGNGWCPDIAGFGADNAERR